MKISEGPRAQRTVYTLPQYKNNEATKKEWSRARTKTMQSNVEQGREKGISRSLLV